MLSDRSTLTSYEGEQKGVYLEYLEDTEVIFLYLYMNVCLFVTITLITTISPDITLVNNSYVYHLSIFLYQEYNCLELNDCTIDIT